MIVDKAECYYFGVWPGHERGHYLHGPDLCGPLDRRVPGTGLYERDLDKIQWYVGAPNRYGDVPEDQQVQGPCKITHAHGFTFVGWWDRTEDSRHGSVSMILVRERVTFEDAIAIGREGYPGVFQRLDKAGIVLSLAETVGP